MPQVSMLELIRAVTKAHQTFLEGANSTDVLEALFEDLSLDTHQTDLSLGCERCAGQLKEPP